MSTETLKPGTVVKLKSEKYHPMTIESISGSTAECVYFSKEGEFRRVSVQLEALKKYGGE